MVRSIIRYENHHSGAVEAAAAELVVEAEDVALNLLDGSLLTPEVKLLTADEEDEKGEEKGAEKGEEKKDQK